MRNLILVLAALGLVATPGAATAAPDPLKAAFQAEVCSVLTGEPPDWMNHGDDAAYERARALGKDYRVAWTQAHLALWAGRSTCRNPHWGIDYMRVTQDHAIVDLTHNTGYGSVDCYYERANGQWRQFACVETLITVD